MAEDRVFCAQRSQQTCEPMLGSAPRVDAWLMVECNGLWGRKALRENPLPDPVRSWIVGAEQWLGTRHGMVRTQLIKQRRARDGQITVMLAEHGGLWRRQFATYDDLSAWRVDAGQMQPVTEPQYFVCTNGRRDLCCSKYGLPLFRSLRALVGARAWETTHTGGHRFAPNVVVLPQGILYGRVLPEAVAAFVRAVESGDISLPHLRGRSAWPKEAQAAESLAPNGRLIAVEGDRVRLAVDDAERLIAVRRSPVAFDVLGSCGDAHTEPVYPLEVCPVGPDGEVE